MGKVLQVCIFRLICGTRMHQWPICAPGRPIFADLLRFERVNANNLLYSFVQWQQVCTMSTAGVYHERSRSPSRLWQASSITAASQKRNGVPGTLECVYGRFPSPVPSLKSGLRRSLCGPGTFMPVPATVLGFTAQ